MRNDTNVARLLVGKREFAGMVGFSSRTVDKFLASGMPHLAVGRRRVMMVPDEALAWLRERYGTRRRGPAVRVRANAVLASGAAPEVTAGGAA